MNPNDTDALGNQAIAYAKTGNNTIALQLIARARKLDAKNIDLMYTEATIHAVAGPQRSGRRTARSSAAQLLLDVVATDPEFAEVRKSPEFATMLQEFSKKPTK